MTFDASESASNAVDRWRQRHAADTVIILECCPCEEEGHDGEGQEEAAAATP